MKQLRDQKADILHFMGVCRINVNGTLQETRDCLVTESSFIGKHRFLFITKSKKLVNPKKESSIIVRDLYQHSVKVKILHGAGKFSMPLSLIVKLLYCRSQRTEKENRTRLASHILGNSREKSEPYFDSYLTKE